MSSEVTQTEITDMLEASGSSECSILMSTVKAVANWSRKNSIWPLPLGLSCCGIEYKHPAYLGGVNNHLSAIEH